MIRQENQYFGINRILLLAIGLWPYQQSRFTRFQHIFMSVILTTIIIFQLTTFLTLNYTLDLFMKVLSSASFFVILIIKYNSFRFNIKSVKDLLMQLQEIHYKLKDVNEIAIVKKYDCIAKRYITLVTTLGICIVFACIILQFWVNVIHLDLSMNVSHYILLKMEYFIDQEKYFYLILLHINVAICIASVVVIAIGTLCITFFQHICGMFKITSYRIEYAININIQQSVMLKNKIWMIKNIIYAVDIHRKAIKLVNHFTSTFEKIFFILVIFGVACLSLNLFQLTLFENNVEKVLEPFTYVLVCIVYMYIANLLGQTITDHNNLVFITAYNVQWYKTPLCIQRMILFLLQVGTKEFVVNISGIFDASLECFATLIKTSLSYFIVIYSTR